MLGNYIRTDDGFIAQITKECESFRYEGDDFSITKLEINRLYKRKEYPVLNYVYSIWVTKESSDLIELIEQGDIINGEQVIDTMNDFIITNVGAHHKDCLRDNLKTFLTHEIYQKKAYKNKPVIKHNYINMPLNKLLTLLNNIESTQRDLGYNKEDIFNEIDRRFPNTLTKDKPKQLVKKEENKKRN